jgi:hypothetical protein
MSVAPERKENEKQWDVKTITIPTVPYSFWGIKPGLIPQFVELYGKDVFDDYKEGKEYLNLSFNKLKKLVAFLHKNNYDTAKISEAMEQAIKDIVDRREKEKNEDLKKESEPKKEESGKELFLQLQQALNFFNFLSPKSRIIADGLWGPASAQVLNDVIKAYHLPEQKPSEELLKKLQAINLRVLRLRCTNNSLVAAIKNNPFLVLHNGDSQYRLEPKEGGTVLQYVDRDEVLISFPKFDYNYLQSNQFPIFSAWLMLLHLKTGKKYEDFCDLWVKKEEDAEWNVIEQSSANDQEYSSSKIEKSFLAGTDLVMTEIDRHNMGLSVKFIPHTNFDIEVIAVYFSSAIQFRISRGEKIGKKEEAGDELFFSCERLF